MAKPVVVVTGVSGNLGSRLLPLLGSYSVIGVDVSPPHTDSELQFENLDLGQESSTRVLYELLRDTHAYAVVHLAFIIDPVRSGVLDVERYDLEPNLPIFHGLLGEMDSSTLAGLSLAEKGPYVVRLIGPREASSRGAASLLEVGQTITAWPQLGSEVTLGAATAAATPPSFRSRRLLARAEYARTAPAVCGGGLRHGADPADAVERGRRPGRADQPSAPGSVSWPA